MNYPNSDLKFRIISNSEKIVLKDIDFSITIKNNYGQTKFEIQKDECFQDSDGEYLFTVENVSKGTYFAYFLGFVDDSDYDKMTQKNTDIQELYSVGTCGFPELVERQVKARSCYKDRVADKHKADDARHIKHHSYADAGGHAVCNGRNTNQQGKPQPIHHVFDSNIWLGCIDCNL